MGYKKNSKGMQYFFRARVAAQAFTVLALWAGIYVYEDDRKANNWKARAKAEATAKAKHVPLVVGTVKLSFRTPGSQLSMQRMKLTLPIKNLRWHNV